MSKIIKVHNPSNLPTVDITSLLDLQGDLYTYDKIDKLKASIIKHGVFLPKFVWKSRSKIYITDGHKTKAALLQLRKEGYQVPEIPYVEVPAKSKKEAAEKLLLINSKYGALNPDTEFFNDFGIDLKAQEYDSIIDLPLADILDEKPGIPDEDLGLKGEKGITYKPQYGVIVICKSEKEQIKVFNQLKDDGHEIKIVVT